MDRGAGGACTEDDHGGDHRHHDQEGEAAWTAGDERHRASRMVRQEWLRFAPAQRY